MRIQAKRKERWSKMASDERMAVDNGLIFPYSLVYCAINSEKKNNNKAV